MNRKNTLFYKGIDGFTSKSHIEILEKASVSAYRWWFESLRCSKDYWWVCNQKGKTLDPDLKRVWMSFGDVFDTNFAEWWIRRGYAIFQETVSPPKIERWKREQMRTFSDTGNRILLSVPIDLSEKTLKKQFLEILRSIDQRKVRKGEAVFSLQKIKGVRLKVLESALEVWNARSNNEHSTSSKKLDLYDIGDQLNISPQHKRRAGEREYDRILKERVMRVAVIRMTKRAEALIANAEIGVFPSYESVEPRKRWTTAQQKALDHAVGTGKWMALGVSQIDWRKIRERYYKKNIW